MLSKIIYKAQRFEMSQNALCSVGYAKIPCITMNVYSILEISILQEIFKVLYILEYNFTRKDFLSAHIIVYLLSLILVYSLKGPIDFIGISTLTQDHWLLAGLHYNLLSQLGTFRWTNC